MLVMVEHHIMIHQPMLSKMAIRMCRDNFIDGARSKKDVLGRSMGGNGLRVHGVSKMAFQIFNECDHWLKIRNAYSNFGLVRDRDMHRCAAVFNRERWSIQSPEFSYMIHHVQNHTRSLNEW
jgi:hypothetical protein